MGDAEAVRLMLRAEVRCSERAVIASGAALTERTIFVITDWQPPVDTAVSLRLSFPTLVDPVELAARVIGHRAPGNPGEAGGLELAFEACAREPAAALAAQLRRLSAAAAGWPAEPAGDYRVLLVEDNDLIRDMFAFGMRRAVPPPGGATIDHAEDAERAWSKLHETRYDLVIIDHFLPAEDGASLIARLRRDERLARVPVVAISVGGPAARDATLSAGADLYLDKPLALRDLLHTLRVLARRARTPSGASPAGSAA
jgi:CheY-like chemotaxis protein